MVMTILLLLGVGSIGASEPPARPARTVVALQDTAVQVGSDTLATVEAGTELAATQAQDDWVAITVKQGGKSISGWVPGDHLIRNPAGALAGLTTRVSGRVKWLTAQDFQRMDTQADGHLTIDELLADTKKQTLDDFNQQLRLESAAYDDVIQERMRQAKAQGFKPGPSSTFDTPRGKLRWLTLQIVQPVGTTNQINITFKSWKRKPFQHEAQQMAKDFLQTGDVSKSTIARELLDPDAPELRVQKTRALFKWADHNGDKALTIEEFQSALASDSRQ